MKTKKMKSWGLFLAPVLIVVVLLGFVVMQPSPGEAVDTLGNKHIDSVDADHRPYNTKPPTSGPHVGQTARWGVHDTQIPDEIQVHNLEDGGVIVHYDPEQVNESIIDRLRGVVVSGPKHVILEPYADMDAPIVLTAWGRIERLQEFDEEQIEKFIDAYEGIDHHVR